MKICLISDSHGKKEALKTLIAENKFDLLLFMGDGLKDLDEIEDKVPIKKVSGNCDFFSKEPLVQIFVVENKKIAIIHGHTFKVKWTNAFMIKFARQNFCDILCYGHTHKQKVEKTKGIYLINPGCFANGNYAVLYLKDNEVKIETF